VPSFAISQDIDVNLQLVPISVAQDMAPSNLKSGAIVDIYGVPEPNQYDSKNDSTKLLLSGVSIDSVTANEFGGRMLITLLVPSQFVSELISSVGNNQFMVVKRIVQ
jgi:hypothetical protein